VPDAGARRAETAVIRERLVEALKTIKTSKLGQTTGQAALYELPWYMVIGNPAAGKSTAIVQSGLHFPLHAAPTTSCGASVAPATATGSSPAKAS
jgi:type VI secretion system protein ImpL